MDKRYNIRLNIRFFKFVKTVSVVVTYVIADIRNQKYAEFGVHFIETVQGKGHGVVNAE